MALGDSVISAIASLRKYLPFQISAACGRIAGRYAEIHRRIDLSEFSPALDLGPEIPDSAVALALAVIGILNAELREREGWRHRL